MLWPCIREWFDFKNDCSISEGNPMATQQNEVARIEKLTSFIDLFNYYPVRVGKLKNKNDSNELTFVMNSGQHGTKDERG